MLKTYKYYQATMAAAGTANYSIPVPSESEVTCIIVGVGIGTVRFQFFGQTGVVNSIFYDRTVVANNTNVETLSLVTTGTIQVVFNCTVNATNVWMYLTVDVPEGTGRTLPRAVMSRRFDEK